MLLEEPPPIAPSAPAQPGRIAILSWARDRIALEVDSPSGGFLVLHDVWHPWWRARLDGERVPILRADLLFRAVALPPGRHRLVFTFEPFAGALEELFARLAAHR